MLFFYRTHNDNNGDVNQVVIASFPRNVSLINSIQQKNYEAYIYKWSEYNGSWGKNFGWNDSEIGIHVPILYIVQHNTVNINYVPELKFSKEHCIYVFGFFSLQKYLCQ